MDMNRKIQIPSIVFCSVVFDDPAALKMSLTEYLSM